MSPCAELAVAITRRVEHLNAFRVPHLAVMRFLVACCCLSVVLVSVLAAPLCEAQQCSPPALAPSHALNLFNEQQEYDLGEILAQQISFSLHVIEDETVAGRLHEIGDRLIAQMPPTKIRFRFFLIDSPTANAFAVPGGRVYVTRKLITTVRSEDELAGVIGHEMGHQLAHHAALNWSRIFHDGFGVSKLGDRSDIEDKYNQVLDSYRSKGNISAHPNEEHEQTGADQVAVYAVARAGYSPQAVIDFWDRFTETRGKKGNWLSDFFGNTRPESKRLREFVKDLSSLPKGCIQPAAKIDPGDFVRWQTTVKNYNGFGKKESLRHVLLKRSLEPALRTDLRTLRFSPNGKYLLAQDSGSIFVLSREPLTYMFRIDAPDAVGAHFSPDSQYLVLHTEALRVERWNVAEQRMEDVRELYIYGGCVQEAVSPDGDYLACLRHDRSTFFPLEFTLYDVNTGEPILTKKEFIGPVPGTSAISSYRQFIRHKAVLAAMAFSPDGRYFLLGRSERHLMVDLKSGQEISVPSGLRRVTAYSFAFVGPDHVVGAQKDDLDKAALVKFPSGDTVAEQIPLGNRTLHPVTNGPYAIVRPMLKAPLGILDLEEKRIFRASHTNTTDIFDEVLVSERVNGEVALYRIREEKPFATVTLPNPRLGHLSAASVAPHASAIAVSQMSRGAVWNLQTGEQLAAGDGFRGAFFGADGLYLDVAPAERFRELPGKDETEKDVRRREAEKPGDTLARLDLTARSLSPISTMKKRTHVRQFGSVVLTSTPADDDQPGRDITLEARDAQTGKVLWSRSFAKGSPSIHGQGDCGMAVLVWVLATKAAKEELNDDAEAKRLASTVKESEGSYFVEVVDLRSGQALGKLAISTGRASFIATDFLAAGGTVAMIDNNHRISLYSFKGEKKGHLFAGKMAFSPDGHRLCAEREPGRLVVYDVERLQEMDELTFGARLAYVGFTADSQQFVVLTADQTAYVFASQPDVFTNLH